MNSDEKRERNRAAQRRWYARNIERERARTLKWHKENPESGRRSAAKKRSLHHGLTREEVHARLEAQGGCCAICRTTESGGTGWQGDHDHGTGMFRGVLCRGCNQGIGQLRDDPVALRAAADYLDRHAALQSLL